MLIIMAGCNHWFLEVITRLTVSNNLSIGEVAIQLISSLPKHIIDSLAGVFVCLYPSSTRRQRWGAAPLRLPDPAAVVFPREHKDFAGPNKHQTQHARYHQWDLLCVGLSYHATKEGVVAATLGPCHATLAARYNTPQRMQANPVDPANPPFYKLGMLPLELTIAFCTSDFTVV